MRDDLLDLQGYAERAHQLADDVALEAVLPVPEPEPMEAIPTE